MTTFYWGDMNHRSCEFVSLRAKSPTNTITVHEKCLGLLSVQAVDWTVTTISVLATVDAQPWTAKAAFDPVREVSSVSFADWMASTIHQ